MTSRRSAGSETENHIFCPGMNVSGPLSHCSSVFADQTTAERLSASEESKPASEPARRPTTPRCAGPTLLTSTE